MSKNLYLFLLWITFVPKPYLSSSVNLVYGNSIKSSSGIESRIKGRVVDAETKAPIEFVTVRLFQKDDSIHLKETMTERNGSFTIDNIPKGKYFIAFSYVGYCKEKTNSLEISGENKIFNLNDIKLKVDVKNIENVIVQAKRGKPSIQIDKTIINVNDLPQGEGGTAVDVLRKQPSITQTPEGEITVHGSTDFLVLINGKPTSLKGNEMLHYIPAGEILKIEIIGTPSAKYDAAGSGGIINIITKSTFNNGISGNANVSGDQLGGFASDLLFNYKNEKVNFFAGIDHNKRKPEGDIERWTNNYNGIDTTHFYEVGNQSAIRSNTGFRSGIEVSPTKNDKISFGGNMGHYEISNTGNWNTQLTNNINEDSENNSVTNTNNRDGYYGGSDFSFRHTFNDEEKNVAVSALWNFVNYDDSYVNNVSQPDGEAVIRQNSIMDKDYNEYQINTDYTSPLGKSAKFEAGYQFNLEKQSENYQSDRSNNGSTATYQNSTDFNRNQHAVYSIIGNEGKKIDWKIGLRAEYFNRSLENSSGEEYKKDKWEYYPSLHSIWNIDSTQQIALVYSRRTNKATVVQLDPLPRWYDYYQVRVGNPFLNNEMSDKISMTYNKKFKNFSFDSELYYLVINDKIEMIRTVYEDQIIQNRYENIGTEKTFGIEMNAEYSLTKWWSLAEKVDLYKNRIEIAQPTTSAVKNYNQVVSFTTTKFSISPNTYLEMDLSYYGPSMNSQVELGSFLMAGMTLRQHFFDKKLSFTITGNDIFGLYEADEIIKGTGFDQHIITQAILPIRFSLSYKLNNFKKDEKRTPKAPPAE